MLGSRIGGIPELIEPDCGFTFAPRDPEDLARTTIRFLRLPLGERERFSTAARRRAQAHDRSRHVERMEGHYREALALPRPHPGSGDVIPRELYPLLERAGAERMERPTPGPSPTPLEVLRGIARGLGLPKVLRD